MYYGVTGKVVIQQQVNYYSTILVLYLLVYILYTMHYVHYKVTGKRFPVCEKEARKTRRHSTKHVGWVGSF